TPCPDPDPADWPAARRRAATGAGSSGRAARGVDLLHPAILDAAVASMHTQCQAVAARGYPRRQLACDLEADMRMPGIAAVAPVLGHLRRLPAVTGARQRPAVEQQLHRFHPDPVLERPAAGLVLARQFA